MASALVYTCAITSVLTDCDSTDCTSPGSSVHGISQAETLEWAAISFSRGSYRPRAQTCISSDFCTAGRIFTGEPPGNLKIFLRERLSSTFKITIYTFK